MGCLCRRYAVDISSRRSVYCHFRHQSGAAHFQRACRYLVISVWISFWASCGIAAFHDGSGYDRRWYSVGEYCGSPRGVNLVERHLRSFTFLAVAAVRALLVADNSALGQAATDNYGSAISLGGHGWSSFEDAPATSVQQANQLEFSFRGGLATDYIYRGTTLSDHQPAVGGAVEATFGALDAAAAVASVKLPTQPAAEITLSAGARRTIGDIDLDFGVSYFLYPGEISASPGTDYWQAAIRADKRINELFRVAGGFAYSPNVSNTGAWSWFC